MSTVNLLIPREHLRIVSLIPSATEIVAALGYADCLVGRSHECDFPASVKALPICTEPKFDPVGSAQQIHERVSDLLASALSVYRVKVEVLERLRPTHIITQAQCEVCAVSLSDVEQAVAALMGGTVVGETAAAASTIQIVSLQPERLADVWHDMMRVAKAIDDSSAAELSAKRVVEGLRSRLRSVEGDAIAAAKKRVVCIEWTSPLMVAGNWVPELVTLAGGESCLGKVGEHSDWMSWEDLSAADPDTIVVMPCGYDLAQTRQATENMSDRAEWRELAAVKAGQVYLVDGNQYFNRPGPRLVDSGDILAEIIRGQAVNGDRVAVGWERF